MQSMRIYLDTSCTEAMRIKISIPNSHAHLQLTLHDYDFVIINVYISKPDSESESVKYNQLVHTDCLLVNEVSSDEGDYCARPATRLHPASRLHTLPLPPPPLHSSLALVQLVKTDRTTSEPFINGDLRVV